MNPATGDSMRAHPTTDAPMTTTATNATVSSSAPSDVAFAEALRFWFKLGFVSFGGPAGQIAIMHAELVERRRWISEHRFLHALNYCMVLPGPEAQQLATYIGWLLHKTPGALAAGGLFVLPSLLLLIALSWLYMALGTQPLVAGVLWAIKPAVTAIVLHAAWRIGSRTLRNKWLFAIAIAAFVAIFALDVPFPAIIAGAALLGALGNRIAPAHFALGGKHDVAGKEFGPALIDDHTPPPAHALFSRGRLARALTIGVSIWLIAMAALLTVFGWYTPYSWMAWFFTKAALLTFGGAYAVLPYVYQGAVEQYGWLSGTQMIDGLALGETTPGPLIMVVAFVGFVGGWQQRALGANALALAGIVGATVVTLFTFLPSFVFVLAGAPFIESTRHSLRLSAPLTAITAAVVGVIVNLALFFAYHVLWPHGFGGGFEWASAAIGLFAVAALFRFRAGVIPLIGACATLGLVRGTLL